MGRITTHVLDGTRGGPAAGVAVFLDAADGAGGFRPLAGGKTGPDGRLAAWEPPVVSLAPGVHRLRFATGDYFRNTGAVPFHPEVHLLFTVDDPGADFHLPLLISPSAYTTYRGG